jgi:hypothetical protein
MSDKEQNQPAMADNIVDEIINQAEQEFANMNDEQIDSLHHDIMQQRVFCYDPENYPTEVLEMFEGQYTVPFYLVAERNRRRLEEKRKQRGTASQ